MAQHYIYIVCWLAMDLKGCQIGITGCRARFSCIIGCNFYHYTRRKCVLCISQCKIGKKFAICCTRHASVSKVPINGICSPGEYTWITTSSPRMWCKYANEVQNYYERHVNSPTSIRLLHQTNVVLYFKANERLVQLLDNVIHCLSL